METVNNKYKNMYIALKKAKIQGFYVHDIETHDNLTRFHFTLTTDVGLFEAELVDFDNFDEEHLLKVFRPGFGELLKDTLIEIIESVNEYDLDSVIVLTYNPREERLGVKKIDTKKVPELKKEVVQKIDTKKVPELKKGVVKKEAGKKVPELKKGVVKKEAGKKVPLTQTQMYTVIQSDQESSNYTSIIDTFNTRKQAEACVMGIIKQQFDDAMNPKNEGGRHNLICGIEEGCDERFDDFDFENDLTWENVWERIKGDLESGEINDLECDKYIISSSYVK
jgi:hypothetical protein